MSFVNAIADLTLIAAYCCVLRQMIRGTKYRLFILITTLFLVASCNDILLSFSNWQILKLWDGKAYDHPVALIALNSFVIAFGQACYEVS